MSHLTSLLTLRQPAEIAVVWITQRLTARGFQVEQTFDLHAARMLQTDCLCPFHGTNDCTCQMIVLLVHDQNTQPVTIVLHGHDNQTWLAMADVENNKMDENVVQALLPAVEISEI